MAVWFPMTCVAVAVSWSILTFSEGTRGASDENDEVPTKVVEVPTKLVEVPTKLVEVPSKTDELPTKVILAVDGGHFIKRSGDGSGHRRHKQYPHKAYASLAERKERAAAAEAVAAEAATNSARQVVASRTTGGASQERPHEYTLFFAVVVFPLLLCVAGVVAYFRPCRIHGKEETHSMPATVGEQVGALNVCPLTKAEKLLGAIDSYDCALPKPKSSKQVLRIEARIEGTSQAGSPPLVAPLAQQECVLYSTVVMRDLHDGEAQVPVAFESKSLDFFIVPLDDAGKRIWIHGDDVLLFDLQAGRLSEVRRVAEAPIHWQDFVRSNRVSLGSDGQCQTYCQKHWKETAAAVTFQEFALLVGSNVTVVGELHRGIDGQLSLRPAQPRENISRDTTLDFQASLTSWEKDASIMTVPVPAHTSKFEDKVLVSDSASLLHHEAVPTFAGCAAARR